MAKPGFQSRQYELQHTISPTDKVWCYSLPALPKPSLTNSQGLLKNIAVISTSSKQSIELCLRKASLSRAVVHDPLDRFISISFEKFRLYYPAVSDGHTSSSPNDNAALTPATHKESADYVVLLLRTGITLNGIQYNFYGHSSSHLKSKTCFLFVGSKEEISKKVAGLGEFAGIKTVAKKAKRIGLLFSTAEMAMNLEPDRCQDIPDVATKDYIFTDGCGLISKHLAKQLVQRANIKYRNRRYLPSVFQIRYRGYKGVLMLEPDLIGQVLVKFRDSMKKFKGGNDLSFSVVNYSKPYSFGFLNDEVVLLLHSLGISQYTLLCKQQEHLHFLSVALTSPQDAFRFLTSLNQLELAERVLIDGLESVKASVNRLVQQEYQRMINKKDQQRCRIMIPKSRLLYGVCDSKEVLKEGECFVRVTMEGDGQPRQLDGMEILVTRNPCLHPGDLQKFKAVARPELAHLIDCIVFPTRGKRPSADMMSGGDLDGDTFFVCWDLDLVPSRISEPASYQGAKEPVSFKPITDDDRLVYFAGYSNASLGRVKNLYLDWARVKGPMSSECQELNHLFSMCVDGNRIKIPQHLQESPPQPSESAIFILDVLHDAATKTINTHQQNGVDCTGYTYSAMQLLLSRDDVAMSEFELLKLTYKWCTQNKCNLGAFLGFFDLNQLSDEEKAWILFQLPQINDLPSLILNALTRSSLITENELHPFKLHYPGLRWKLVFDSNQDRMARFLPATCRALELFHRKLIVLRIDTRLTIAIYIPKQIEKRQECQVDNTVRLFAFPHTQGNESFQRRAVPTKINYRLYFDDHNLQLFESKRANTWVFLSRPGSDDYTYRHELKEGARRRQRQATVDEGLNHDCIASIALDKYSRGLQKHVGRVNRCGILGAETYVISNRDTRSIQLLDLWLDFVDTEEVVPLFEKEAREYTVPILSTTDWSTIPEHIRTIARDGDFSPFKAFESIWPCVETLNWLLERGERGLLRRCFEYLLETCKTDAMRIDPSELLRSMLEFVKKAPFLSLTFANTNNWDNLKPNLRLILVKAAPKLLDAIVIAANVVQNLATAPFQAVLSHLSYMPLEDLGLLIEKIAVVVRSPEVAMDLLLGSLQSESSRLLIGRPKNAEYYLQNLIGIALDHIDEASQPQMPQHNLLHLTRESEEGIVSSSLRIDLPSAGRFKQQDHVRLTTASSPSNVLTDQIYSMDAFVEASEPGRVKFRCLHPLPLFLEECSWKAKYCGSFVTCKAMFNALGSFATQTELCCEIHDQLLGLAQVESESGSSSHVYAGRKDLNKSQNKAVEISLASALTCLWGPPGTGKTHTIVVLLQELLQGPEERRILVTAPTHNAVDNVLRKFLKECSSGEHTLVVEPIRVTTDVRKVAEDLRSYTCDAMIGKEVNENFAARRKAQARIKKARLVFTTCIGSGLGLLRTEKFDTVIIDEASQQTEPASLVPLVKGCAKAVLVGDHLQLRATVQQHAAIQGFDVSLFERLYTKDTIGAQKIMLDSQYRMHREICHFSSREFYESNLHTAVPDEARPLPDSDFPWPVSPENAKDKGRMLFVQCSTTEDLGRQSKSNKGQAAVCANICMRLMKQSLPGPKPDSDNAFSLPSIAVLTPYTAQAELLGRMLPSGMPISSIDGFQGREADIIIFVTVRCNLKAEIGFLKDLRRLNVVMTRARAGCIVIGDRTTLTTGSEDEESTSVWKRLLGCLTPVTIDLLPDETQTNGKNKVS